MDTIASIAADPDAPVVHRFESTQGRHALIVPYSRLFDILPDSDASTNDLLPHELVHALAAPESAEQPLEDVVIPSVQSISLNVSSSCNLSCSYCYASRGSFGGAQSRAMDWETARAAIDALFARADPRHRVTVGFMGGEPFVARSLLHRSVTYAADRARHLGIDIGFSVTTNGTLLRDEDIDLIRSHRMAVTVSIDGGVQLQDLQRPHAGKQRKSSFEALARATAPLLANPGLAMVTARATVVRSDMNLERRFHDIIALGFAEAGFSPLRQDDEGRALRGEDWTAYLDALKKIADGELSRVRAGGSIRLANLTVALNQIARGASSPYPCGAGGGYFSVGADGHWYACHRAIGQSVYDLGDNAKLDPMRRRNFLRERHVHAQAACRSCWARYLCSGSCHQEASARSDSSCGFIRGWLDYCLRAYCELTGSRDAQDSERKCL